MHQLASSFCTNIGGTEMEVIMVMWLVYGIWAWNDINSTFPPPAKNVLYVTYVTDPPGAVIYSKDARMGYAPITLNYQLNADGLKRGIVSPDPITARWISGASTIYASRSYEIAKSLTWTTNIARPANVEGLEKDEQFALQVQSIKQRELSDQTQMELQFLQLYQTQQNQNQQILNQSLRNATPPSNRINCKSTSHIPGQVDTTCF